MFRLLKKRIGALFILFVGFGLLLTPAAVHAHNSGGITLTAQAGFNGTCRINEWIPVQVNMDNQGADFDGQLEIVQTPAGSNKKVYAGVVTLPNPAHKLVTVYVYPEGYLDSLSVKLVNHNGQVLATATAKVVCMGPNDRLFGILADVPDTFSVLSNLKPDNGRTYLAHLSANDIPVNPEGLNAMDLLIVSDIDTGTLTAEQQDGIQAWVSRGGRLIITGGLDWKRTSAGLGNLIPIQPGGTLALNNLNALATFTGRQDSLGTQTSVVQSSLIKTGTQTLLSQDGTLLVLKKQVGQGEIDYLTFDPALEPFSGWAGREDFYRQLFGMDIHRPVWGWGFRNWDAAIQAVRTVPGDPNPGTIEIIGFILVYVLVIGPVNYWILRRYKKTIYAWITIPGLIVLFCLGAYIYGSVSYSSQPILNRLAVVQISPDAKLAYVDGLVGINSPVSTAYSLEAGNGLMVRALPRSTRSGNLLPDHPWVFKNVAGGGTLVDSIPVDPSGFEGVAVQGEVPTVDIHGELTLQLIGKEAQLSGVLTNNSDVTLKDAALLTPWGAQKLDSLAAHGSRNIQYPVKTEGLMASQMGLARPEGESILELFTPKDDALVKDLMGDVESGTNPVLDQRAALLSAFGNGAGRQSGLFLAGWGAASPLDIKLSGQKSSNTAATLYLVSINTKINLMGNSAQLDPAMFSWQTVQNSGLINPTPYNTYLGQGSVSFDFKPVGLVKFKSVESLTLHLENNDASGTVPFSLSLWNWNAHTWSMVSSAHWGDVAIETPTSFVDPDGVVRMRIEANRTDAPFLKRADVSLVVHP